jgi:hypothetical protein
LIRFEITDGSQTCQLLFRTDDSNERAEASITGPAELAKVFEAFIQIASGPFGMAIGWPNPIVGDVYFALTQRGWPNEWEYGFQILEGKISPIKLKKGYVS